jgi:hypothetical protein
MPDFHYYSILGTISAFMNIGSAGVRQVIEALAKRSARVCAIEVITS